MVPGPHRGEWGVWGSGQWAVGAGQYADMRWSGGPLGGKGFITIGRTGFIKIGEF